MQIKITHWFDTEEESGCCQTWHYSKVAYFTIEDQSYANNGLWLMIALSPDSPEWEKHKEMGGLVYINYEPGEDEVELFDDKE